MSNTFLRTFQHLVDANTVLQSGTLPPLQRAPAQAIPSLPAPALPPPSTTDKEIKIIQGITYSSKNLLHAGHRYSKDDKLLTDGRQSWRCASTPSMRHSTASESHTTILTQPRQTSYRQSQADGIHFSGHQPPDLLCCDWNPFSCHHVQTSWGACCAEDRSASKKEDEPSPQSSSLPSWPGTGCMLSLNLYVIL